MGSASPRVGPGASIPNPTRVAPFVVGPVTVLSLVITPDMGMALGGTTVFEPGTW